MSAIRLLRVLLAAWVVSAAIAANTPKKASNFVTTDNIGQFSLNHQRFRFFGTNVYWLPVLETEDDIDKTLGSIAKTGMKVVRTFAFNDVDQIPQKGTWFQLISNDGTIKINDGPNGLQKLDTILRLAEKHGIFVILTLTNNWNPRATGAQFKTPRNYLSNDYGGMDLYVRNIAHANHHDEFYTNPKIFDAFSAYVSHVAKRYADCPSLLGWELANDARCYSTFPASKNCTTKTVTAWHAQIAKHLKSVDPNHLVSSGNHGFLCIGCPKLFPLKKRDLLEERGNQIDFSQLSAFNGFHGVDNADILNIPQIDFSTFQLFLEQNTYGPSHPGLSPQQNAIAVGIDWIRSQATLGTLFCKPVITTAFGTVTKRNAPFFVPFNSSQAPYFDYIPPKKVHKREDPPPNFAWTDMERRDREKAWTKEGSDPAAPPPPPGAPVQRRNNKPVKSKLQGMAFYQWSQENLKPNDVIPSSGISPNDGYSIGGPGKQKYIDQVVLPAVQQFSN